MSDREQQIQNRLDRTLNPDDGVFLDGWLRTSVPDLRYLLDLLASERQARAALEQALEAVQSQCAGHSDEFSARVWNIAHKARLAALHGAKGDRTP